MRVVTTFLENVGSSPITPADIIEPLGVEAAEGWKIVNVNTPSERRVRSEWTRESEERFVSTPELLNPGDMLIANVYLTYEGESEPETSDDAKAINWTGRVVNLSAIKNSKDPYEEFVARAGPVMVTLWIWPIVFILTLFPITTFFIVRSFVDINIMSSLVGQLGVVVGVTINLCAIEAIATLIFGGSPLDHSPQPLSLNLPIIIVDVALLAGLYVLRNKKWKYQT